MLILRKPWDRQPLSDVALLPELTGGRPYRGILGVDRQAIGVYAPTADTTLDYVTPAGRARGLRGSGGYATGVGVAGTGAWTVLAFGSLSAAGASAISTVAESPAAATYDRSLLIGTSGLITAYTYDTVSKTATSGTVAPAVGCPFVAAAVCTGTRLIAVHNGQAGTPTTVTAAGYNGYSSPELVIGYGGGASGSDGGASNMAANFSAFYVVMLQLAVPLEVLRQIGDEGWRAFEPRRILVPVSTAAASAPTITALSARLITSTSAQPRISYS